MVSSDVESEWVSVNKGSDGDKNEFVVFIEQFVKNVCSFSSQYGSDISISYTAYNIAGKPSKFPDYGDFPQAFVMRTYGRWWEEAPSSPVDYMPQNNGPVVSQDYIDVAYHHEVYPVRVSVYETYNPGSLVGIWAADSRGQWVKLWSGWPQIVPHKPRIFSPPLLTCRFKTRMLRLEFNHSQLDYYTELDAVLLIGTSELIQPHVGFHDRSLSALLKQLGGATCNEGDPDNLTPDYSKSHDDIKELKSTLQKHCVLYKSKIPSKGNLVAKLGIHSHCIPPIEEAFNSLQQFLQEDFPKLIRELNLSTSASSTLSTTSNATPSASGACDSVNETCGSFSVLPDETVLKILRNLDLKSLCRCCKVNRHFNNIARDAFLYTSLNLKPYWYCMDAAALRSLVPRCQYLQRLDLSWCGNYDTILTEDIVDFLNSCGSQLTHLRLNNCQFVNNAVILVVSASCRNLRELCLRNCLGITKDGFWPLTNLHSLERLELYRTTAEAASLCAILRVNPEMRHLNLAACDHIPNMDDVATEMANSCPLLESVDFWKTHSLSPRGLRALARCVRLREVDFGWCLGMEAPGSSLHLLIESCPSLEKVFLAALRGLTDPDVEPLLGCRHLRQLDLLGARSLTREVCQLILHGCPQLRMIDLSFCEGISDATIFEWRELYPHVSIKRSFQASGLDLT